MRKFGIISGGDSCLLKERGERWKGNREHSDSSSASLLYLATSHHLGVAVWEHVKENLEPHTEAGRKQWDAWMGTLPGSTRKWWARKSTGVDMPSGCVGAWKMYQILGISALRKRAIMELGWWKNCWKQSLPNHLEYSQWKLKPKDVPLEISWLGSGS